MCGARAEVCRQNLFTTSPSRQTPFAERGYSKDVANALARRALGTRIIGVVSASWMLRALRGAN